MTFHKLVPLPQDSDSIKAVFDRAVRSSKMRGGVDIRFERFGFTYTINQNAVWEDFCDADNEATNNVRAPWAERTGIRVERSLAKQAA